MMLNWNKYHPFCIFLNLLHIFLKPNFTISLFLQKLYGEISNVGEKKRTRGLRGWLRSLAFVFAYFCYCHFIKVIKRWPLPPSYSLLLLLPPIYSIFPPEFFSNRIYFCSVVLALTLVVMHQILRTI